MEILIHFLIVIRFSYALGQYLRPVYFMRFNLLVSSISAFVYLSLHTLIIVAGETSTLLKT